jgi:hypothetical protein
VPNTACSEKKELFRTLRKGSVDIQKPPNVSTVSKKTIKNSTEPFEGSAFYPLAEPSLTEPFFWVLYSKKRFREKIRNLEGSVQNH